MRHNGIPPSIRWQALSSSVPPIHARSRGLVPCSGLAWTHAGSLPARSLDPGHVVTSNRTLVSTVGRKQRQQYFIRYYPGAFTVFQGYSLLPGISLSPVIHRQLSRPSKIKLIPLTTRTNTA